MPESENLLLAVSCVFLVSWYGVTRFAALGATPGVRRKSKQPLNRAFSGEFRDSHSDLYSFPGGAVACPHCGTEYPAGVLYCDCGAECVEAEEFEESLASIDMPHEDEAAAGTETDELICVHVAENQWKASLLRSFLGSHDIPCATGGNTAATPYPFNTGPMGEVRLFVHRRHAQIALRLIHTIDQPESQGRRDELN